MGYSSDGATFAAGTNPIPESALLMRNIILGAEFIMSHITHLYHLAALDYVMGPPMAPWTPYFNSTFYQDAFGYTLTGPAFPYSAVTDSLGNPLGLSDAPGGVTELNSGTTVWSKVILDYVQALHERRKALEAGAVFSGGLPMFRNLVPGGVTYRPTTGDVTSAKNLLFGSAGTFAAPAAGSVVSFIKNHAMPVTDILSVLFYWADNVNNDPLSPGTTLRGPGGGWGNYLAWGTFPSWSGQPGNPENTNRLLKRGKWITDGGALGTNIAADVEASQSNVREFATWSKYTDASGPATGGLHPSGGITDPSTVAKSGRTPYSWGKAPRYYDTAGSEDYHPMEVGPLARMIVTGAREGTANEKFDSYKIGDTKAREAHTHHTLGTLVGIYANHLEASIPGALAWAVGNYTCGASILDRHRARALEAIKIAEYMEIWLNRLNSLLPLSSSPVGTRTMAQVAGNSGYGTHEAPRGALAHFVTADSNSKISNYQCVVPTTWNVSPAHDTARTVHGPIEKASIGIPCDATLTTSGEDIPLNILRVIHSFDPCIACTVHVVDAAGNKQVVDIDDAKPIEVEEAIARNVHEIAKKEVSRR